MALGTMGPARLPVEQRPQPGPLRYGLFNVAPPQTIQPTPEDPNLPDHAYGGGLVYDPVGCGDAHNYAINCDTPVVKTFDPNSPEVTVLPWNVYASLVCGTYGYTPDYLAAKNGLRLYANEQEAVEAAFWSGGFGNAPILTAAGATDVGAGLTFADITDAVAALERFAYANYGYHAVLHANSAVHAYAADANLVHSAYTYGAVWGTSSTSDPTLRTALGTKWVFGGGYPGTGPLGVAPAAGKTYIWITGNVTVWRQPTFTPSLQQTFDRTFNQWNVLSERGYLATFDCMRAFALVDIPDPAV